MVGDDDDYFPDWLLFEILLRLPLNSVFKFRIVSKRWLSVASAHYFIRAYASRASSSSLSWIVLPQFAHPEEKLLPTFVQSPSNNLIPRALHLQPSCTIPPNAEIREASDDGLALYSTYAGNLEFDLYICNPITGDRAGPVRLRPPDGGVHLGLGFLTCVDEDFTLKSYRIVQATQRPGEATEIIFNVYHSEIGDWRRFTANGPGPNWLKLQESAAVLDGVLYWADKGSYVIAYDLEAKPKRQVRFIRDPLGEEKPHHYTMDNYSCVACRGELRYFGGCAWSNNGNPEFNIWKLEDSSSGEWRLVHKIGKMCIRAALQIVCFDPLDSDVVYMIESDYGRSAFSYSLKNGTLDNCREMIVDDDGRFSRGICRFPKSFVLVVPPWPVVIAEKHLERRLIDR